MSADVRVRVGGAEVAKWLARRSPVGWRMGSPVADGVAVIHVDAPVYRDLEGTASDVPTLGEDAEVEFLAYAVAGLNPAELALAAIQRLDADLGGLLSRATRLEVEVDWGRAS